MFIFKVFSGGSNLRILIVLEKNPHNLPGLSHGNWLVSAIAAVAVEKNIWCIYPYIVKVFSLQFPSAESFKPAHWMRKPIWVPRERKSRGWNPIGKSIQRPEDYTKQKNGPPYLYLVHLFWSLIWHIGWIHQRCSAQLGFKHLNSSLDWVPEEGTQQVALVSPGFIARCYFSPFLFNFCVVTSHLHFFLVFFPQCP